MKKIYSLVLAALMAVPAMAQGTLTLPGAQKRQLTPLAGSVAMPQSGTMRALKAPAMADEMLSLELSYNNGIASCIGINAGQTGISVAFPAAMLSKMVGNQITAINVASPVNIAKSNQQTGNWVNTLTTCKVSVSESLGGTPVVETTGTLGDKGFEWNAIKLDTPYTIPENKSVFITVMYDGVTQNDAPLIIDGTDPLNNYSCYLYSRFGSVSQQGQIVLQDNYQWKQFGQYVGNACLSATVEGATLPTNMGYVIEDATEIAIKPGKPFQYGARIYNEGATNIENVELTMTLDGQEPQSQTVNLIREDANGNSLPVLFHDYGDAFTTFTCEGEGYINYTVAVTKVNGVANEMAGELYRGTLLCLENGYPINVVCEELTSTRCAYCPIGIVGLEQMKSKYGANGRFIPIAVHANIPSPTDPMNVCGQTGPYYEFLAKSGGGAPASFFMRNMDVNVYPHPNYLEEKINEYMNALSPFEVGATLTTTDNEDVVTLTVQATSALDDATSYGFVYTIVEDNVGPYTQVNGYSGQSGNFGGWESKPSSVSTIYNDVARLGSLYKPATDAVLPQVVKGKTYTHTYSVDVSNVTNLQNYSVVAMLVNMTSGRIENACVVKPGQTGVEGVVAESVKAVAYGMQGAVDMVYPGNIFTVDGRMVAAGVQGVVEVPAGIYVVATANGTAKVVVR